MTENNLKLLELFDYWLHIRDQYFLAVRAIPDDKLNWKPKGFAQSFAEIIGNSIKKTYWGLALVNWNSNLNVRSSDGKNPSKKELVIDLEKSRLRLFTMLANLKIEDLSKPVKMDDGQESTLKWLIFYLLENDIQCRTQIFMLLQMLGIRPPKI
ncbi:MAG: DinB family protein [candidate division Zixibacteria bacterium]|nr:DinB family protein [candidate division Zixibacteria bacterium]